MPGFIEKLRKWKRFISVKQTERMINVEFLFLILFLTGLRSTYRTDRPTVETRGNGRAGRHDDRDARTEKNNMDTDVDTQTRCHPHGNKHSHRYISTDT